MPINRITDSDTIKLYLEDSAHFPGAHSNGLYKPKNEQELVEILKHHHASGEPLLVQGGRTSLTGGATPFGEIILSLENLNTLLKIKISKEEAIAIVQPFVRLKTLNEEAKKSGYFYPPTPTYDLATIGGTIATCAAGGATYKYGTTRNWVKRLRVLLANGDAITIIRGKVKANAQGIIEFQTESGKKIKLPIPLSYQTPLHLKKVSCGYMAYPNMDLIDLFIGSEGTLGIVTEIELGLAKLPASLISGLAYFNSEDQAFEFVRSFKESQGNNLRAMEFLDAASLDLIRASGFDKKLKIAVPALSQAAIYFELELEKTLLNDAVLKALELFAENQDPASQKPATPVEKLFYQLRLFGALNPEELVLALPQETQMLQNIKEIREAVPQLLNEQISQRQTKDPQVTKIAADVIVPFERIPEMVRAFRQAAQQAFLKIVIFGHISDGNLHPNILVSTAKEVRHATNTLRQAIQQVIELGGAPMAEHGVGRNRLKQEFLKTFYGEKGILEMARLKLTLDPRGILSPGVIFSADYLKNVPADSSVKIGAAIQNVGDEEGALWQFSLKSLTKTQHFVNHFLARFLKHNPKAVTLMRQVEQAGHKTSGYMTDYIAIPYSPTRVRELKKRGFVLDKDTPQEIVFRHIEGIFPPFIIRNSFLELIDTTVLEEQIPIEYEYDEEDIWVALKDVWAHLPTLEESYSEIAKEDFPFITDSEIPEIEVGWRVGDLNHFKGWYKKIQGKALYKKGVVPKPNDKETQLVLVQRKIGLYNGFDVSSKAPSPSLFLKLKYVFAKNFYFLFQEMIIFLLGMERLVSFSFFLIGPQWTRHLLNEIHDAEWIRHTPKGKKDKDHIEKILGKGGWKIFVDHRTFRRSLLPHLSLLDRLLSRIGFKPNKPMGQNEVCFRILKSLGLEMHEDYIPNKNSDWKARVLRDRNKNLRKNRSQLAYFLDEALPGKRGNIATYSAFWGATTGWSLFDLILAFFKFDWGPDPWFFHHIAIEGNFNKLARATEENFLKGEDYVTTEKKIKNADEVGFLERFSFMWFLRQVFSKEIRFISHQRLQALYLAGRLTQKEYNKYLETEKNKKAIVEGPHLEIIDRRSGIPWFNQVRVTQAIETSSQIKVDYSPDGEEDKIEPWRKRIWFLLRGK